LSGGSFSFFAVTLNPGLSQWDSFGTTFQCRLASESENQMLNQGQHDKIVKLIHHWNLGRLFISQYRQFQIATTNEIMKTADGANGKNHDIGIETRKLFVRFALTDSFCEMNHHQIGAVRCGGALCSREDFIYISNIMTSTSLYFKRRSWKKLLAPLHYLP
jgi:hypothetical protein